MAETHLFFSDPPVLSLGGMLISKVDHVKISGSLVFARGTEKGTYEHRIGAGWACYNKWRHILESKASIEKNEFLC